MQNVLKEYDFGLEEMSLQVTCLLPKYDNLSLDLNVKASKVWWLTYNPLIAWLCPASWIKGARLSERHCLKMDSKQRLRKTLDINLGPPGSPQAHTYMCICTHTLYLHAWKLTCTPSRLRYATMHAFILWEHTVASRFRLGQEQCLGRVVIFL